MISLALALALGATCLHGIWNVLLKTSGDPLRLTTRATGSAMIIMSPIAVVAWLLVGRPGFPPEAWLLAALSGMLELAYFVCLSTAYRHGELSLVYPLARGTAPLLAVPIGLVLLRERLSPIELAGVGLLLVGIWVVRRPVPAGPALLPALATGIFIAAYSAVDREGVQLAAPWLYAWVLGVITALLLVGWLRFVQPRLQDSASVSSPDTTVWSRAVVVGVLMVIAYLMVLFALRLAPLAIVAPVREAAIVLVTGWGIWRLGERQGAWLRLGGAAGILLGIGLVALR
jgi:drug/metabolite transporter (DMT)-like permease